MAQYASKTTVTVDRSKQEIEAVLRRYGATAFGHMWNEDGAAVLFEIAGRRVTMRLPLPDPNAHQFRFTAQNRPRSQASRAEAYDQAVRQRWRALVLIVKAKLEAVESGITTVEREFLADVTLPDGRTVGDWAAPQLEQAYGNGNMPALLPGVGGHG